MIRVFDVIENQHGLSRLSRSLPNGYFEEPLRFEYSQFLHPYANYIQVLTIPLKTIKKFSICSPVSMSYVVVKLTAGACLKSQ